MPHYVAVSKELHLYKRWSASSNFKFASKDALCPLVMQEAPRAALQLPIAFSKAGDHIGLFVLQGLEAGSNYLVDNEGRWLAEYIPAAYRGYPFILATTDNNDLVLCFDMDSGLISETEGNAFFDDEGKPGTRINEALEFLSSFSANSQKTHLVCLLLEELDILEPWPINIKKGDQNVPVGGLFRVNEIKFNSLDVENFVKLRDKGALPLIFCHLLSMQNLARIAHLFKTQSTTTALPQELDFDFTDDNGNISFDGL